MHSLCFYKQKYMNDLITKELQAKNAQGDEQRDFKPGHQRVKHAPPAPLTCPYTNFSISLS